jgi:3-methyladenine DNA glycosylase/8-oxoguanine DNA glycosylase
VPELLGGFDRSASEFRPRHPVLAEAVRRWPGWRPPRTRRVLEALVPAILEQKVTSTEAWRAWRDLLHAYGEPAPGPTPRPMRIPLPAEVWRRIPSWHWHTAGVDGKRSATVLRACQVAGRLEATTALAGREAAEVLRTLPGVGPWTAAEVTQRAHGCPDTVSVGDLHLPGLVGWALAGEPWADDERMLELLEPYAGARQRAVRMVELACAAGLVPPRPRRAPRYAPRDFRSI